MFRQLSRRWPQSSSSHSRVDSAIQVATVMPLVDSGIASRDAGGDEPPAEHGESEKSEGDQHKCECGALTGHHTQHHADSNRRDADNAPEQREGPRIVSQRPPPNRLRGPTKMATQLT